MANPNFEDGRFDDFYLFLEDTDFTPDGKLIPLAEDNGKIHVVMVFATWCGNCTGFKEEYAKLINMIDKSKVKLYFINGSSTREKVPTLDSEMALMKRLKDIIPEFRGFPTMAVFGKDGKHIKTHNGPRKAEAVMDTISSC